MNNSDKWYLEGFRDAAIYIERFKDYEKGLHNMYHVADTFVGSSYADGYKAAWKESGYKESNEVNRI